MTDSIPILLKKRESYMTVSFWECLICFFLHLTDIMTRNIKYFSRWLSTRRNIQQSWMETEQHLWMKTPCHLLGIPVFSSYGQCPVGTILAHLSYLLIKTCTCTSITGVAHVCVQMLKLFTWPFLRCFPGSRSFVKIMGSKTDLGASFILWRLVPSSHGSF